MQGDLHRQRRIGTPPVVPVAPEQHQDGVTAELDDLAAVPVSGVDQCREARVDQLRDLLGARLALAGQPFRQRCEPGDVG